MQLRNCHLRLTTALTVDRPRLGEHAHGSGGRCRGWLTGDTPHRTRTVAGSGFAQIKDACCTNSQASKKGRGGFLGIDRFHLRVLLALSCVMSAPAYAADLIVSANDGKFVRVEGKATYPQPAPSDSLAILDASRVPPALKAVVEGIEHTISGPPQAVAITPDGKLAVVGAPSRYDYDAKKESFGTYLQLVDLEASPPKLIGKVEIGAHPNGLAINPQGTLLLAAAIDGTLKVVSVSGKDLKLGNTIKVGEKRLSGASFTHDGKAALVALRDEGGLAVLDVDGQTVKLTNEQISTGIGPYNIDVSSDGKWAAVGNAGLAGLVKL